MARNQPLDNPESQPVPIVQTPSNEWYFKQQLGDELPTSFWDSIGGAASGALHGSIEQQGIDYLSHKSTERQNSALGLRQLSVDEANLKYPQTDKPFTAPVYDEVAAAIARDSMDRREMQSVAERGPQGFMARGARWSAQMALSILDPAFYLSGGAVGKVVGIAGKAAGLGDSFLFNAGATGAKAFGRDVFHGAIGGAIMEQAAAPFVIANQQDYSDWEAAKNIAKFSLGFGAIHAGVRALMPKTMEFSARNPEMDQGARQGAINQMANDRAVDVSSVIGDTLGEQSGRRIGRTREYAPLTKFEDYSGHDFFAGSPTSRATFAESHNTQIEHDLGNGIYLSDHPVVANGTAASKFNTVDGKVWNVEVGKGRPPNIINLEKPFGHGPARDVVESYLSEVAKPSGELFDGSASKAVAKMNGTDQLAISTEKGLSPLEGMTGKQVLAHIGDLARNGMLPPDAMDQVASRLQDAGFDGYRHEGGKYLGAEGDPHNVVMMFDKNKTGDAGGMISEKAAYQPDRGIVPAPTPQALSEAVAKASDVSADPKFDPETFKVFEEVQKTGVHDFEIADLEAQEKEFRQELEALKKQGVVTPAVEKAVEAADEEHKKSGIKETIAKAFYACFGKGA